MGSFDWIADFAGKLPMDVISEMMGVPEEDRAEVRRQADIVVHREDGMYDVPPAGAEASMWLVVYYQAMVDQRRKQPTDDLTSALHRGRDGRRAAQRRGRHRLPLPHGRGRQRDHDQAARPRAVPPDPAPGPARDGLRRRRRHRARRALGRGDAALRHLQPAAGPLPAPRRRAARRGGAAGLEAAALPRLGQPRRAGLQPARPTTTSPATRTSSRRSCPSAAAGTSASAPTSPGSRRGSR